MLSLAVAVAMGILCVGCGKSADAKDEKKGEAKSEATSSDMQAELSAVAENWMKQNSDEVSKFKSEKVVMVTKDYAMLCGHGTTKKGSRQMIAFHFKKSGSQWLLVDLEDHWEPKDKFK